MNTRLTTITTIAAVLCCAAAAVAGLPAASHDEQTSAALGVTKETTFAKLSSLCVDKAGRVLACDERSKSIRVFDAEGKPAATWPLSVAPSAMCACPESGAVYVGTTGAVVKLDAEGKEVARLTADDQPLPKRGRVTAIAVSGKDVFISYCYIPGNSVRGMVYRMTADLAEPTMIAKGYRGCCGNLDIDARDGKVYVAENAGHRIVVIDRNGKLIERWGKRDRTGKNGFGSCCNPMGVCVGADGSVYTAEDGPNQIKRFNIEGDLQDFVGPVGKKITGAKAMKRSCSNGQVAVNADGSRVYVLDEANNIVRVLVGPATVQPEDETEADVAQAAS